MYGFKVYISISVSSTFLDRLVSMGKSIHRIFTLNLGTKYWQSWCPNRATRSGCSALPCTFIGPILIESSMQLAVAVDGILAYMPPVFPEQFRY